MGATSRPYRGVSASDRKAERRARLLEAGLELLGTEGFERTTMTAVCSAAKLTERYFYESFGGREELLLAVIDQIAAEVRDAVLGALREAEGEVADKARAAIRAFVTLLTADPRKGRVAIIESSASAPLRLRRHELLANFAALVVTQAEALHGRAALPQPRAEINALLFVGGLAEVLTGWLTGRLATTPEELVDAATHQFVTAMHR
ncbi:TetR/AcrR family transcriptional regulator [Amycolatopsis rhizosphaerae]|uniref:TetR/AcrR family transcriptional regulator n=1 Tax=Amycolatopsis rhizosphaerae TaxID=2053003 RepID=A0A558D323_9PSEU|nr:TetR/AcrR family transcriptional regulator [Amycolatopsis rhizosphaerae]TVT55415.1 TetR/AcrR family transcriptional regulator [Amycolatopsis rhizosphaerae]